MNRLPLLTDDEVRYICSVIPHKNTVSYFKANPNEFAKICPGFRASSIIRFNVGNLLFRHRGRGFVSSFVEKQIDSWLIEIQDCIDKCLKEGDSRELSYLHTLPFCYFAGDVALYFKLVGDEHPGEYILLLASAIKAIKQAAEEQEKIQANLEIKKTDVSQLQRAFALATTDLNNSEKKLNRRLTEIKELKYKIAGLDRKLKTTIQNNEELVLALKAEIRELENITGKLKIELSDTKNNYQQLEAQVKAENARQQAPKFSKYGSAERALCPKDMDEFKDYLGYNLENIGIPTGSNYYFLLKEHLSNILFQGIPIVASRCAGMTLMKCVSNTLIGTVDVKTLTFSDEISAPDVNNFLSTNRRIVCLDNFIGNFNETELLPLFERHRNKIIFLTIAYDRTLHSIPSDFLRYCHYLNLNRIEEMLTNTELTEDPSIIEEIEIKPSGKNPVSRFSILLGGILKEVGIRQNLANYKCFYIFNELDLCCTLAFDILPYCVDVLQIAPFNISERLTKYSGNTGSCKYRKLLLRWFT